MPLLRLFLVGVVSLSCLGCSAATPRPPSSAPVTGTNPAKNAAPQPAFPAGNQQVLKNSPLPFDLSVPELASWQRTDQRGRVTLEHAPTSTKLVLRHWTTSRLVTQAQCEQELLSLDPEALIRAQRLASVEPVVTLDFLPGSDYRGTLSSKVMAEAQGPVLGWVHGVAAGLGHCLAFDAKTSSNGPSAQAQIGERLSILMDVIAASVRLRAIDERPKPEKR